MRVGAYKDFGILRYGNNLVANSIDGLFEVTLEVSGTSFPNVQTASTGFQINSSIADNIMTIDFADGTGEHSFNPTSGNNHSYNNTIVYYFQDVPPVLINTVTPSYSTRRFIKFRFRYPEYITYFNFQNMGVHGEFPKRLGMFNLATGFRASLGSASKFDSLPTDMKGFNGRDLIFIEAFTNRINRIPNWVGDSSIVNLTFQQTFDLSGLPSSTNIEAIGKIKRLDTLILSNNNLNNDSFFDNLKSNPSLTNIEVPSNNNLTTIPTAISNCSQINSLSFGSSGGSFLASWGDFSLMTRLNSFSHSAIGSATPLTVPNGIDNCILLKTYFCRNSYRTQARCDAHVNNWYDFIIANASVSLGNTKFRQMTMNFGYSGATVRNERPSGVYQDVATPTTPMEKIWKMVNVYKHTWHVSNETNNGNVIYTP